MGGEEQERERAEVDLSPRRRNLSLLQSTIVRLTDADRQYIMAVSYSHSVDFSVFGRTLVYCQI